MGPVGRGWQFIQQNANFFADSFPRSLQVSNQNLERVGETIQRFPESNRYRIR